MPDGGGMSGLDMSEVGVAAQKAGQQVKKIANPFLQAAKSQISGKPVQSQGQKSSVVKNFGFGASDIAANIKSQVVGSDASAQQGDNKQSGSIPPTDTPTSGTFDIAGFAKSLKQQVAGTKPTLPWGQPNPAASGSSTPAQSSHPPSENIPTQKAGAFEDQFPGMKKLPNAPLPQQPSKENIANQEEIAKKQAEDKQKYQALLNKLHQMQSEDVMKVGESDKKKEDEDKQKKEQQEEREKEQKEQEKEEKMQIISGPAGKKKVGFMGYKKIKKAMGDMLGAVVKRKQGSHEGSGGKG